MHLNISFKHMETSDALKIFIEEKSGNLKKYFDGQISVTWNLSVEKQSRIVHCHLVGNRMDYFGEADTEDFKASIDVALEKIERQVRKHKEIVKDRLHRNGHRTPAVSHASDVSDSDTNSDSE
jgi:putative sigma-54 modulation protein